MLNATIAAWKIKLTQLKDLGLLEEDLVAGFKANLADIAEHPTPPKQKTQPGSDDKVLLESNQARIDEVLDNIKASVAASVNNSIASAAKIPGMKKYDERKPQEINLSNTIQLTRLSSLKSILDIRVAKNEQLRLADLQQQFAAINSQYAETTSLAAILALEQKSLALKRDLEAFSPSSSKEITASAEQLKVQVTKQDEIVTKTRYLYEGQIRDMSAYAIFENLQELHSDKPKLLKHYALMIVKDAIVNKRNNQLEVIGKLLDYYQNDKAFRAELCSQVSEVITVPDRQILLERLLISKVIKPNDDLLILTLLKNKLAITEANKAAVKGFLDGHQASDELTACLRAINRNNPEFFKTLNDVILDADYEMVIKRQQNRIDGGITTLPVGIIDECKASINLLERIQAKVEKSDDLAELQKFQEQLTMLNQRQVAFAKPPYMDQDFWHDAKSAISQTQEMIVGFEAKLQAKIELIQHPEIAVAHAVVKEDDIAIPNVHNQLPPPPPLVVTQAEKDIALRLAVGNRDIGAIYLAMQAGANIENANLGPIIAFAADHIDTEITRAVQMNDGGKYLRLLMDLNLTANKAEVAQKLLNQAAINGHQERLSQMLDIADWDGVKGKLDVKAAFAKAVEVENIASVEIMLHYAVEKVDAYLVDHMLGKVGNLIDDDKRQDIGAELKENQALVAQQAQIKQAESRKLEYLVALRENNLEKIKELELHVVVSDEDKRIALEEGIIKAAKSGTVEDIKFYLVALKETKDLGGLRDNDGNDYSLLDLASRNPKMNVEVLYELMQRNVVCNKVAELNPAIDLTRNTENYKKGTGAATEIIKVKIIGFNSERPLEFDLNTVGLLCQIDPNQVLNRAMKCANQNQCDQSSTNPLLTKAIQSGADIYTEKGKIRPDLLAITGIDWVLKQEDVLRQQAVNTMISTLASVINKPITGLTLKDFKDANFSDEQIKKYNLERVLKVEQHYAKGFKVFNFISGFFKGYNQDFSFTRGHSVPKDAQIAVVEKCTQEHNKSAAAQKKLREAVLPDAKKQPIDKGLQQQAVDLLHIQPQPLDKVSIMPVVARGKSVVGVNDQHGH